MMQHRAALARRIGHRFSFRGIDRIVRALYSPDRRRSSHVVAEIVAWDGTRYLVDTRTFIEWSIYVYGGYERSLQVFMHHVLREGDVVVDCGANIGAHACAFARHVGPEGTVLAVEPVDELADRLEHNFRLNEVDNFVTVRAAAGAARGEASLFRPRPDNVNQGLASLTQHAALTEERRVSVVTIDDIVEGCSARGLRLVKVDVEGHELEVLLGARRSITRWKPVLVFEHAPDLQLSPVEQWAAVRQFLVEENGYSLSAFEPHQLQQLGAAVPAPCVIVAEPCGEGHGGCATVPLAAARRGV